MTMIERDMTAAEAPQAFRIERWAANSGNERQSRASLVLQGGGRQWRAHATGNGAVDALMRAADEALRPVLGRGVELLTYEVRATGQGHDTAATVAVSIRQVGAEDDARYPGTAVHENVLEASLGAYVDAVNQLLTARPVDLVAAAPEPGHTARHASAPEDEVRHGTRSRIMTIYNE